MFQMEGVDIFGNNIYLLFCSKAVVGIYKVQCFASVGCFVGRLQSLTNNKWGGFLAQLTISM